MQFTEEMLNLDASILFSLLKAISDLEMTVFSSGGSVGQTEFEVNGFHCLMLSNSFMPIALVIKAMSEEQYQAYMRLKEETEGILFPFKDERIKHTYLVYLKQCEGHRSHHIKMQILDKNGFAIEADVYDHALSGESNGRHIESFELLTKKSCVTDYAELWAAVEYNSFREDDSPVQAGVVGIDLTDSAKKNIKRRFVRDTDKSIRVKIVRLHTFSSSVSVELRTDPYTFNVVPDEDFSLDRRICISVNGATLQVAYVPENEENVILSFSESMDTKMIVEFIQHVYDLCVDSILKKLYPDIYPTSGGEEDD